MKSLCLVLLSLPVLLAAETSPRPPSTADVVELAAHFLTENQNANGSWGSAHRTKGINIYAPVPGAHHAFRMGATCLCLSALIQHEPRLPNLSPTIDRAEKWLLDALPRLKRANGLALYNVWGHAYALRALADLASRSRDKEKIRHYRALGQRQYEALLRYEMLGAGWGYFNFNAYSDLATQQPSGSSNSFVTATVLGAIAYAQKPLQLPLKATRQRLSIKALLRQKLPDGSYLYGDYLRNHPRYEINRPVGSLARTPAAHAALLAVAPSKVSAEEVTKWADRFLQRHGFLYQAKKRPLPHEGAFALSGYFYFYGHYYLSQALWSLEPSPRGQYSLALQSLLVAQQQPDGSWWDYPLYNYHKFYGTGYALSALHNLTK